MKPINIKNDTTKSSSLERKRVYVDEHNEKVLDLM